jgi:hypothetical protein
VLTLLLATAALAGPPTRCEAVYAGPTSACALSGQWTVTGTGKAEAPARKAALQRLEDLVDRAVESQTLRTAGTLASATAAGDAETCGAEVAKRARVYCYAEPELAKKQLCFADLAVSKCWRGRPIDLEAPAWRAMEEGRGQLCSAVDQALSEDGATPAERLSCQVSCLQEAQVRCVDGG